MGPAGGDVESNGVDRLVHALQDQFRATMGAFLITLVSLTVVIWFTQGDARFRPDHEQRQTLLVFIGITGMIVPLFGDDDRAYRAGHGGGARPQ